MEALTEPSVGVIESTVSLVVVVIHDGRDAPDERLIVVKEPVVAHEFAEQDRIAGLEVYAFEDTEGKGRVTVVVDPTAAL